MANDFVEVYSASFINPTDEKVNNQSVYFATYWKLNVVFESISFTDISSAVVNTSVTS